MTLSPARLRLALLIFVSWVVVSSLLLFYLGNRHYGVFANDTSWQNSRLTAPALNLPVVAGFQLVHVFAKGCSCNLRAQAHVNKLSNDKTLSDVTHYFFSPEQTASAGLVLPATPAVLIFFAGELLYAGPYASGPLCAVDDSVIVPILKQDLILPGRWLNGETSACRCPAD